ncbi:hypothetical protein [Prauserella endophytica]|uniref:Uncharacterized protein n=1 Tax=Prauserella endophytica TaxID=1592324 RepID=A0ABY2SD09_9PSEU|nr:hypothetical protein [Prauserella endophytica]TKG73578.1 hypothetical protein FCN18_03210 [Prauserella endophytica]
MPTDAYLAFLGLGLVMIVADGQILYHSGKRYLSDVDTDMSTAGSQTRLIAVLFHIVMLGFMMLLSVFNFDFGGGTIRAVVGNLGVLLLVLGLVHAVTMAVLSNMHDSKMVEESINKSATASGVPTARTTNGELQRGPVVAPVPGQPGRDPRMSPTIENQSL